MRGINGLAETRRWIYPRSLSRGRWLAHSSRLNVLTGVASTIGRSCKTSLQCRLEGRKRGGLRSVGFWPEKSEICLHMPQISRTMLDIFPQSLQRDRLLRLPADARTGGKHLQAAPIHLRKKLFKPKLRHPSKLTYGFNGTIYAVYRLRQYPSSLAEFGSK